MKKDISPELYNYNKYPGPAFARVENKIVSEGIELILVEDHKEAFDQTQFGQRFSALMLKFDYIVGDWGNEQLRLKGFYKDDKEVKTHLKISRLEDYQTEYCNYGCAYFVLENPAPQDLPEEPEDKPRRRRKRNNRKKPQEAAGFAIRPVNKEADKDKAEKKPNNRRRSNTKSRNKRPEKTAEPRGFVIRKKGE